MLVTPPQSILPTLWLQLSISLVRPQVMPELDLFVVHWNQPEACLATVQAFSEQGVPLRITVIDNDSSADAYSCLQTKLSPEVTLVRLEDNKGWGGALNVYLRQWLRSVRSPYCLISAHDAMPAPDCSGCCGRRRMKTPKVGIACPQYPTPFISRLSRWRGVYPETGEPETSRAAQKVDVPHGTLMLVRGNASMRSGFSTSAILPTATNTTSAHAPSAAIGKSCLSGARS